MKTTYPKVVWHGTEDNPFRTDETGMLITPEKLTFGHYRLDEVEAPEGYVLAGHEKTPAEGYNPEGRETESQREPLYIEFQGTTPIYLPDAEDDVLEVVQYNSQQKGRISVEKEGELLEYARAERDGNLSFTYEQRSLEGVSFEIIAEGDIISQDGSGSVVYKNGNVVEKIVTDKDGHAWSGDLLIGNYILRETDAPKGYLFVLDEHFNITKIDQDLHYTYRAWNMLDGRQELDIQIVKTEKDSVSRKPLKDAEFTLYAAEDIHFGKAEEKEDGQDKPKGFLRTLSDAVFGERLNVIHKDTAARKAVTDENGKAVFGDIPAGKYYVLETKAPKGYLLNKNFRAEFTVDFDGSRTNERVVFSESAEDVKQKLNIEITKEDSATRAKLSGAEFTLYDSAGMAISTAISDGGGIARFKNLSEGTYSARETKAPQGYSINTEFQATFKLAYDQNASETLTWKAVCGDSKAPSTPALKNAGNVPKTGDGFSPLPLILALLLSASLIAIFAGRIRKTNKAKV
jgi:uncharacterized surface anchored protein